MRSISTKGPFFCSSNGCNTKNNCDCEPCPICGKVTPGDILTLKNPIGYNGQWIGKRCVDCDVEHFAAVKE